MAEYRTLSFKKKKTAKINEGEIKSYFGSQLKESKILFGIDERNNLGYYVQYILI